MSKPNIKFELKFVIRNSTHTLVIVHGNCAIICSIYQISKHLGRYDVPNRSVDHFNTVTYCFMSKNSISNVIEKECLNQINLLGHVCIQECTSEV